MDDHDDSANTFGLLKRRRVLLDGIVFAPAGAIKVRVREISSRGAHVWAETPIVADCDAIFKKGMVFAAAHVVSSNEREAFLQFYRELTQRDAEYLLNRVYHKLQWVEPPVSNHVQ